MSRKNFGAKPLTYPQPVFIIATYDAVSYTHLDVYKRQVFKEVDGTDWVLVSYIPKNIVLAELIRLRTIMIIVGIICIMVLCVLVERMTNVAVSYTHLDVYKRQSQGTSGCTDICRTSGQTA